MTALLTLFLMLAAVKNPGTALRDGCSAESGVVGTFDAGTPIKVRYALAGEAVPCYKVTVETQSASLDGFLPASAISGLEEFEKGLRDAAWQDASLLMTAIRTASQPMPSLTGASPIASQAAGLIESSQPAKALELLENELRKKSDPTMLALAGGGGVEI